MLACLIASLLVMINSSALTDSGVVVSSIEANSTASTSGLTQGEIITAINGKQINNLDDYSREITSLFESSSEEVKLVLDGKKGQYVFFSNEVPKITFKDISKTNLKTGLDLQGGARALVRPEKEITDTELQDLISVSTERLNVYGISDVSIRPVKDLEGNSFMLVEIAGATPRDIETLISQQGKFEAKIGNQTVFTGGTKDITYVCRNDATCAAISSCSESQGEWFCNYEFQIHLSEESARRHAEITNQLGLDPSNPGYLDKKIEFYVDDSFTTSLFISEGLKGLETTQIQISGSGKGVDRTAAFKDAEQSMKQMQTILISGSLPYKLEIEKLDTISPLLGRKFTNLIFMTAIAALVAVSIIVFIRYRRINASLAILFTGFSEIVILLGVASLIGWNLDLPSIVGILVMIGTGVDQQIILLDESRSNRSGSIKEKLRWGLFIIMASYFTALFSLLPLWWAGAGLLRGFMVTTIVGLTIGVFITRPAFADMLKVFERNN